MKKWSFVGGGEMGTSSEWAVGQTYREIAAKIVADLDPERVLEIGPYGLPLFEGADTIDNTIWFDFQPTYFMDVTAVPWEMESDSYDLIVALQVFEHLWPYQGEVFRECLRVAPTLVMSVPYHWPQTPDDVDHEDIDEQTVRGWFGRYPDEERTVWDRTYICFSDDPTPKWGRYLATYHRGDGWREVPRS